jgi:hypothetical protein
MPSGTPNTPLAGLLAEAQFSTIGFARRVRDAARPGSRGAQTSTTQVTRWLGGQTPRDETIEVCGLVLARGLGRPVSRDDMGFRPAAGSVQGEVHDGHAARLWRVDASDNQQLLALPFAPQALDRPVVDWLLGNAAPPVPHVRAGLPVTEFEVARAADMLALFRQADHAQGAGGLRDLVVGYLSNNLADMLARPAADAKTETELMVVAAGMCEMVGYQAVDVGAYGLAQRYYLHSLGFSAAVGGRAYASHLIAANVAHLALHTGHPHEAVRLVQAAHQGNAGQTSPAAEAAFHSVEARAHARLLDEPMTTRALAAADAALERSTAENEPVWMRYFTPADLEDEKAHCMHDLGRHASAQTIARSAIADLEPTRTRRLAIDSTLLATSLAQTGNVEEACSVGVIAVGYSARTQSHRTLLRITELRAALEPYAGDRRVAEFEEYVRVTLPQAG